MNSKNAVLVLLGIFSAEYSFGQLHFPGQTCTNDRLATLLGVSAPGGSRDGVTSADGKSIAFTGWSSEFLPGAPASSTSQLYFWDRNLNQVQLLSMSQTGVPGNGASEDPYVSQNGIYVVFSSVASNLDAAADTNGTSDIFMSIPTAQATFRVSTGAQGQELSGYHYKPSVSDTGRVLFVSTNDTIVAGDNNGDPDVFLRDEFGQLYRLSNNGVPYPGVAAPSMPILHAEIAANGQAAIFSTQTNILGEQNLSPDIFYVDLSQLPVIPAPIPVSSLWSNRSLPAGGAVWGSISGDGERVAFSSGSWSHLAGDINDQRDDLFIWEKSTQSVRKISAPLALPIGFMPTMLPKLSFNGRWVTLLSRAVWWDGSIVEREENDTILYDLDTNRYEVISRFFGGGAANNEAVAATTLNPGKSVSDDGKTTLFETETNRVIANFWSDQNGRDDVFVASCTMPEYPTTCSGDGSTTPCPTQTPGAPGCGCPNSTSTVGAKMEGVGFASISEDHFKFKISNVPPGTLLCLAASLPTTLLPTPLGSGLKCIGDNYVAGFSVVVPPNGKFEFGYGTNHYPSLGALIGMPQTAVIYQGFYLDTFGGATVPVNSTNALRVYWGQ